jgi:hypothetical protein
MYFYVVDLESYVVLILLHITNQYMQAYLRTRLVVLLVESYVVLEYYYILQIS